MMQTGKPKPFRYLVVELGDNDFGHTIARALKEGVMEYAYHEKFCPLLWKKFIIAYVLGDRLKHEYYLVSEEEILNIGRLQHLEEYLQSRMRVLFEDKIPKGDHDGGNACIDILNPEYAWNY